MCPTVLRHPLFAMPRLMKGAPPLGKDKGARFRVVIVVDRNEESCCREHSPDDVSFISIPAAQAGSAEGVRRGANSPIKSRT